jgi:hypothetical protein
MFRGGDENLFRIMGLGGKNQRGLFPFFENSFHIMKINE